MIDAIVVDTTTPTPQKKIYAQIAKVMTDLEAIGKSQRNDQQKFNFRGIDNVYNELHEHMAKHCVFTTSKVLSFERVDKTSRNGGAMIHMIARVEYRFHADDGSFVETESFGESADSGDKAATKCLAIAHKYALLQVFMIPTEDTKGQEKDPDHYSPEFMPVNKNGEAHHGQTNQGAHRPQGGWAQRGASPRDLPTGRGPADDDIPDPIPAQNYDQRPSQPAARPSGPAQRPVQGKAAVVLPKGNQVGAARVSGLPGGNAPSGAGTRQPQGPAPREGALSPQFFAQRRAAAQAELNRIESEQAAVDPGPAPAWVTEAQPSFEEFNEPGSEG